MFVCNNIREATETPYWYFQLTFVVAMYVFLLLINLVAATGSQFIIPSPKPKLSWLMMSSYISGMIGTLGSGTNDFIQTYQGFLEFDCGRTWDRGVLSRIGCTVGIFSLLGLSIARYRIIKRTTPWQYGFKRRVKIMSTLVIWLLAFAFVATERFSDGTVRFLATQVLSFTLPLLFTIITQYCLIKKLTHGRVMCSSTGYRSRTEKARQLITLMVSGYCLVLLFAILSLIFRQISLPNQANFKIAIWMRRLTAILRYSAQAIIFLWKTPEMREWRKQRFSYDKVQQLQRRQLPSFVATEVSAYCVPLYRHNKSEKEVVIGL